MIWLNFKTHSAATYRFSTDDKGCQEVKDLKANVKKHNDYLRMVSRKHRKVTGDILRVRLMGRGKRKDENGKSLHFSSVTCLQHKYAKHFDVYVSDDSTSKYALQEEIDTGLTSGEQRKVLELRGQISEIEWRGRMKIRTEQERYNR